MIKLAVNGLARQVANHDDILFIPLKAVHRLDLQGEAQTVGSSLEKIYPLWLMAEIDHPKNTYTGCAVITGLYIYIYIYYLLVRLPPANWTVYYGSHGQERLDD